MYDLDSFGKYDVIYHNLQDFPIGRVEELKIIYNNSSVIVYDKLRECFNKFDLAFRKYDNIKVFYYIEKIKMDICQIENIPITLTLLFHKLEQTDMIYVKKTKIRRLS